MHEVKITSTDGVQLRQELLKLNRKLSERQIRVLMTDTSDYYHHESVTLNQTTMQSI